MLFSVLVAQHEGGGAIGAEEALVGALWRDQRRALAAVRSGQQGDRRWQGTAANGGDLGTVHREITRIAVFAILAFGEIGAAVRTREGGAVPVRGSGAGGFVEKVLRSIEFALDEERV